MLPEQRYGSVHLYCLRHPIHAEQCRAAAMRNLRRRAAVRSTTRTNMDHARSPDGWAFQLIRIAMLDPATIALINGLGSLRAIAISHPHFYTTMVEWSRAFGGIPIHLHADDHR